MNHWNAAFILILAICAFNGPHQIVARVMHTVGNPLIPKVCEHAKAKNLCVEVLQSDPTSRRADLKGLAMISLKVSSQYASSIASVLKKLDTDDELAPAIQQGLADCKANYLDAQSQVADAMAALVADNMGNAQKWLFTALAATDTCDDAIKGNDPILFERNQRFRHLLDIALGICKDLPAAA